LHTDAQLLFTVTPVDFDSEAVDDRLKLRSASWILDFKIGSPEPAL